MSTVDRIKERWPLTAMLARCGISVPARGKFRSPFRPDENPSCEIWNDLIRDRSTNETFDSIRVFAKHKGISNSEAIKQLAAELPGSVPATKPEPHKLGLPNFHYTTREATTVAKLRGLSPLGPELAGVWLGTLRFAVVCGFPCWLLIDGSKRLAEARRMDGESFSAIGSLGERKSHTLRGSCKSWPLGMNPQYYKLPAGFSVVLVEGGPDYLAACDVLAHSRGKFLPVAMLGASQSIHPEALPFFKGREVLIWSHPDKSGVDAAKRWSHQLRAVGAKPKPFSLQGGDLNDLVKSHGAKTVATDLCHVISR